MPPSTSTVPVTPSSGPSSLARTGAGATSTSWCLTQAAGRSVARWRTPSRDRIEVPPRSPQVEKGTMKEERTLTNEMPTGDLQLLVNARDHVQGPATAPVTLVEYADY
jgi:hypothetical protein